MLLTDMADEDTRSEGEHADGEGVYIHVLEISPFLVLVHNTFDVEQTCISYVYVGV